MNVTLRNYDDRNVRGGILDDIEHHSVATNKVSGVDTEDLMENIPDE